MKKKDLSREAILRAAEALIQKWGIHKTTLEDVACEAGKGKSSIYYYFPNKEALIEAVAMAQAERIVGAVRDAVEKKAAAKAKLLAYVTTAFRETRRAAALFEIAKGELRANRKLIHGVMEKYRALQEREVEEILRFGNQRQEFRSIGGRDVKAVARAVVTVMRSLILDLFLESDDRRSFDLIIEILSGGL